ncbi:MAG: hypothetical protein GX758_01425 [Tenericutes bacterium]|nr:hypothetical protein [Mycoplasmatota bacterium]
MKDKVLTILFTIYITIFMVINIIVHDKDISYTERRRLTTFPKVNINSILDASFFNKIDKYVSDQFILRDEYRSLKSFVAFNIFKNTDNNKVFILDNNAYKIEYPLKESNIDKNINKINSIINSFNKEMNVYYSIIPDKSYFLNSDKYLKLDYDYLIKLYNDSINGKYIDITAKLTIEDYYKTDPHWREENIDKIANILVSNMNNKYIKQEYKETFIGKFLGSYYNEILINLEEDDLVYLSNEILDNVKISYLENEKLSTVYNINNYNSIDPYSIYLDGATSFVEIENNKSISNKELIIFRDSYGSSIVPLMIPYYKKLTIVDIRYMKSDLISSKINYEDQDVLFLYSTLILNGNSFK